jgi:hypothetical protein
MARPSHSPRPARPGTVSEPASRPTVPALGRVSKLLTLPANGRLGSGTRRAFHGFKPLVCRDDAEAIEKAKRMVDGHDIELWSGVLLVIRTSPARSKRLAKQGPRNHVVQTANPTGFKWTVYLDATRVRTGDSYFGDDHRHRLDRSHGGDGRRRGRDERCGVERQDDHSGDAEYVAGDVVMFPCRVQRS